MTENNAYKVLARKYRPTSFADLRGQEVLVRTLSNAIESGRIAHAFVLTGIRGIGKTTTARIIARALNCTGPNGDAGPTINPCGVCANCKAIAEDRHMDVIEMDAATNTGVDNVRDIVETVQYAPAMGRYKIFIIDEVHMLSKSAFNALLKTLEEPPPYIKFIFATTELRKIPVTILSRCQRFDLRRLDTEALAAHLTDICQKEQVDAEAEALTLIASAGDGSVRDSLSLLDQAIAHSSSDGGIQVKTETVRQMLGLVDRSRIFALIEALAQGDAPTALATYRALYGAGADIATLLEDVAEVVHFITQVKLDPALADDVTFAQGDREQAKNLATQMSIPALSRLWQMTIKGLQEVQIAPSPHSAVQMVLIRIAYAGTLPTPGEIIGQLQSGEGVKFAGATGGGMPRATGASAIGAAPVTAAPAASMNATTASYGAPQTMGSSALAPMAQHHAQNAPTAQLGAQPQQAATTLLAHSPATQEEMLSEFAKLLDLFTREEPLLHHYLRNESQLVKLEPGRLELQMSANVPKEAAGNIGRFLSAQSAQRWVVVLSQGAKLPSLQDHFNKQQADAIAQATEHPLAQAAILAFPGAVITAVNDE
jgi:DNA polymerase-3 subunit gamma/tau